jgi:porin
MMSDFVKRARAIEALFAIALLAASAGQLRAQTAAARSDSAPASPTALPGEINPRVVPGLVAPTTGASGRQGPLAPLADDLDAYGVTLHANSIDFLTNNPSAGLIAGNSENSLYNILGVDWDLSKVSGLRGTSLHYETTIFAGNTDIGRTGATGFLGQTGDSLLGYQGTFNQKTAVLSVATIQQKLFDDRLAFEIGRTHPDRYYGLPLCQVLDSCFQDILYYNAGFTSPQYSVYGANLSYKVTPTTYVEAGAFSTNDGTRIGYDLGEEKQTGVLGIGEIGYKTDFATEAFPTSLSLTGFYNSSDHAALNAQTALGLAGGGLIAHGTSGLVLQGSKVVWRADGGAGDAKVPTSVLLYGSLGDAFDATTPIRASAFVGATLQAPFAGRPADRFGVKFNYERLNTSYAQYLAAANFASGGSGAAFLGNEYVFEGNAHIQLPAGLAFEPTIQYAINPNSYYNPLTARRPSNGVFAIGTLIIPVGVLLGLTAG